MKTCLQCKKIKEDIGRKGLCSACQAEQRKEYLIQYRKEYKKTDKKKASQAAYRNNNKDKRKKWESEHKERKNELQRKSYKKNKHQIASRRKNKKESNPVHRTMMTLRRTIALSLSRNNYNKTSRTCQLLGCSFPELMEHLGPKPEGKVHLDHIVPCSQAQTQEEAVRLQHYTNLRWLSAFENLQKADNRTSEGEELCRRLLGRDWIE